MLRETVHAARNSNVVGVVLNPHASNVINGIVWVISHLDVHIRPRICQLSQLKLWLRRAQFCKPASFNLWAKTIQIDDAMAKLLGTTKCQCNSALINATWRRNVTWMRLFRCGNPQPKKAQKNCSNPTLLCSKSKENR